MGDPPPYMFLRKKRRLILKAEMTLRWADVGEGPLLPSRRLARLLSELFSASLQVASASRVGGADRLQLVGWLANEVSLVGVDMCHCFASSYCAIWHGSLAHQLLSYTLEQQT